MLKIIRGEDKTLIIDRADFTHYAKYRWWLDSKRGVMRHRGAKENHESKTIYFHREIMNADKSIEIDHINRNPLDNRRENLRVATRSTNCRNQGVRTDNVSGYKGVSWKASRNRWLARINFDGKIVTKAGFKCKHEAARAYNELAKKYHGEFAFINEIKE